MADNIDYKQLIKTKWCFVSLKKLEFLFFFSIFFLCFNLPKVTMLLLCSAQFVVDKFGIWN